MSRRLADEVYHYGIGRARFAQGEPEDALAELSQVSGDSETLRNWDYRTDLVFRLSSAQQIADARAYRLLRGWLVDQQTLARARGDEPGVADVHAALLWLVRDHYWALHRGDEPEPGDVPSRDTSPLELRAHPDLFAGGESNPAVQRWSARDLPRLLEQLRQDIGVVLPALLLQLDPSMAEGAYQVRVYEALAGGGRVLPDAMHCPDIARCQRLGLRGPTLPPAGDGRRGYWLTPPDLTLARRRRLELRDPQAVIFGHLQAIIHRQLDHLVGFEEVQMLIDEWPQQASVELAPEALRLTARATLVRVVRSLLGEQVPITRLDIICARLAELPVASHDDQVLRHVRQGLIPQLPGNDSRWQLIALSQEVEEAIAGSLVGSPDSGILMLDRKAAARLAKLVQTAVDRTPPPVAVVVTRPELRRFTHRLLRADGIWIPVLASDELLPDRRVSPPRRSHRQGAGATPVRGG